MDLVPYHQRERDEFEAGPAKHQHLRLLQSDIRSVSPRGKMIQRTVVQQLAEYIVTQIRPRVISGVSGANIEDLFGALQDFLPSHEVKSSGSDEATDQQTPALVLNCHEFSAATCADASARLTNEIGICLATSGGAALNLIAGLAESALSRVPVLAIIGQPPLGASGAGAFQETSGLSGTFDLAATLRPMLKRVEVLTSAESLPAIVANLIEAALQFPRGPVALLLPKDVQALPAPPLAMGYPPQKGISKRSPVSPDATSIKSPDTQKILQIIAQRPLGPRPALLVGREAANQLACIHLKDLAQALQAKVYLTIEGLEFQTGLGPLFDGVVGAFGSDPAHHRIAQATGIWAIGTSLSQLDRFGIDKTLREKLLWYSNCHSLSPFGATPMELPWELLCSPHRTRPTDSPRLDQQTQVDADNFESDPVLIADRTGSVPLTLSGLAHYLSRSSLLRRPINWVADAGNASATVLAHLRLHADSRFVIALGAGGMGYSFGAAIGAYFSNRLPTIAFAGDGSVLMHGMELHTWAEQELPILLLLADNQGHAMCTTRDNIFHSRKSSLNQYSLETRYQMGLRELFGIAGATARTLNEVEEGLKLWNRKGPFVLEMKLPHLEMPNFLPFESQEKRYEPTQPARASEFFTES